MKTITRITSVLLFSLLVLTACSKDDDGGTSAAGDGELTATVDGASFESFPEATTAVESNSGGIQILTISGGTMDSENIQISIIGFEGVGTYDLNSVSLGSYTYLEDTSNFNSAMVFTTSTGAASNFSRAIYVRLVNSGASTTRYLVTLEQSDGTDIGTFTLSGGEELVIKKDPTDQLFAANASVLGVAVSVGN